MNPRLPNGDIDWANDSHYIYMVWDAWFFQAYIDMMYEHIFVCSPSGSVLRMGPEVFSEKEISYFHPKDGFPASRDFLLRMEDPYMYLDSNTFTIDVRKKPERQEYHGTIGTSSSKKSKEDILFKLFQQFQGWALCIPSDAFPKNFQEIYDLDHLAKNEEKPKVGRPSKIIPTRLAFEKLYPSGRNEEPWKQVQKRLRLEANVDVSIETIKRSVEQNSTQK